MSTEVRVPTLGESVSEATIATWFKKSGDQVEVDEMLCELETDKVTVEVPSPVAGTIAEIIAPEGSIVSVEALLVLITEGTVTASVTSQAATAAPASNPVMVPTLGESVSEATVSIWYKKLGDMVMQDEMLCELETDKVSVEVPAPVAGVLSEIFAIEGSIVEAGGRLAVIGRDVTSSAPVKDVSVPTAARKDVENAPSAKKLMAEENLIDGSVVGTGKGGRVMKEDVIKTLQSAPVIKEPSNQKVSMRAPVPADDASREERVKMSRLRQTIARRLKDSQNTAAMLTTFNEVDMTEVMALRHEYKDLFLKKHGVKLGFMSFFTKACCHALREVPEVNAEIDGTDIVFKNFVHMGIAAGTPTGLVVPVLRDVDALSFADIEKTIAEKGARARDGKLSMEEMQGGTFTISNGGVYGSLMSAPILNPPQSGILGMHNIIERPVVENNSIVIRPIMYLALSYDHRVIDGKEAVSFLKTIKECLEEPRRLFLDL